MTTNFDFQRYVDVRKRPNAKRTTQGNFGEYAFASDLRILRSMSYVRPVSLAVEATVRAFKAWQKSDLLGSAVVVGPRQFPRLNDLVSGCAETLHIPAPATYVTMQFASINAYTFGTETDSFIMVHSATIDRLTDDELRFVIGHECGHIQNSHVTYQTAAWFLTHAAGSFVSWIVTPAMLALNGWRRRAEITCDRAGLLCCGDIETATRVLVKLAVGSDKLVSEVDVDAYLQQMDGIREGIGRVSEYQLAHPYLPKRVKALQLFAESEYYRRHIGLPGGRPLADIDREVEAIVSVL